LRQLVGQRAPHLLHRRRVVSSRVSGQL
jgi:hypothetical protein